MTVLTKVIAILILIITGNASAAIQHNGHGVTYEISEIDALDEIASRAEAADVEKVVSDHPRANWGVWNGFELPVATKDSTRTFVPWYSLEMDIPGPKGSVLYPKGFTFNPLNHIKMPYRVVAIKIAQWDVVKPLLKDSDIVIADKGDVVEAGNNFGRHIYIMSEQLANRFGIQNVPSIVEQVDDKLLITEIGINP